MRKDKETEHLVKKSFLSIPKSWVLRLSDINTGERPGDILALVGPHKILVEVKYTSKDTLIFSAVKPFQLTSSIQFSALHKYNHGIFIVDYGNHGLYAFDGRFVAKQFYDRKSIKPEKHDFSIHIAYSKESFLDLITECVKWKSY